MEAVLLDSAGSPVPVLVFSANLLPSLPVTLTTSWDSLGFLNPGTSRQAVFGGTDEYGNSIQPAQLTLAWTSSDSTVADGATAVGVIAGIAPGNADLTATAGSATAQFQVRVRPSSITYPIDRYVGTVREAGGRLLAAGSTIWQWDGTGWNQEGPDGFQFSSLWVFPNGAAWAGGVGSVCNQTQSQVWQSPAPGVAWARDPSPPCHLETWVSGYGSDTIFLVTTAGFHGGPVVRRRDPGGWSDLNFPLLVNDSVHQVGGPVAARSLTELYVAGVLQEQYGVGGRASVGYWNGSSWSFPAIPPAPVGEPYEIKFLRTSPNGGPVYGLLSGPLGTRVIAITGGIVTLFDNPYTNGVANIRSLDVGPDGRLAITFINGVAWQEAGGWRELDFYTVNQLVHWVYWGADGTKWVITSSFPPPNPVNWNITAVR